MASTSNVLRMVKVLKLVERHIAVLMDWCLSQKTIESVQLGFFLSLYVFFPFSFV